LCSVALLYEMLTLRANSRCHSVMLNRSTIVMFLLIDRGVCVISAVSEAIHQYIVMIMAGFAGNPHMIACTVLALTKLVHNHRGIATVLRCFTVIIAASEVACLSFAL